jgi:hypothetical protein
MKFGASAKAAILDPRAGKRPDANPRTVDGSEPGDRGSPLGVDSTPRIPMV